MTAVPTLNAIGPAALGPIARVMACGRLSLPADLAVFAPGVDERPVGFGVVRLHSGTIALHVTLNPDGLRQLAALLSELAQSIEKTAMHDADALLGRIQAKGGQA